MPLEPVKLNSKRKMLLYLILFILLLLGLRLLWFQFRMIPEHPHAQQGTQDLRKWNFTDNQVITLNGEWEFYPGVFVEPEAFVKPEGRLGRQFIQVPSNWVNQSELYRKHKFATYHLRVLLKDHDLLYGMRVYSIDTASKLFVNGKLMKQAGNPGGNASVSKPINIPYTVLFKSDKPYLDIVIHVSNHEYSGKGGINQSIKFGTAAAITHEEFFTKTMQIIVTIVMLLHGLCALILLIMGYRGKGLVYFAVMNVFAVLSVLSEDDRMLIAWLQLDVVWSVKLRLVIYMSLALFITLCTRSLLEERKLEKPVRALTALGIVSILVTLCLPVEYITYFRLLLLAINAGMSLLVIMTIVNVIRSGEKTAFSFLLAATALSMNILIGGVIKARVWLDMPYYPVDLIIAFLSFASFWFIRFTQTSIRAGKLAEQLLRADKQKDDFLANTSHELRNPLHGMINMAQTVLDEEGNTLRPQHRDKLKLLVTVGQRMSLLLNDLLDATRLRNRDVRLQKHRVNLEGVVAGVFDMVRYMTDGKPVVLEQRFQTPFPHVVADENRLVQILFNLVHNAIKYTREGKVTVEAEIKEETVCIHVKDTGMGMDRDTLERIFEPYEQGDSGITATGGGIGLGLSICRQLVELHGGTLTAQSVPGQGSVFTFTLPVDLEHLDELSAPSPFLETAADTEGRLEAPPMSIEVPEVLQTAEETAVDSQQLGEYRPHILAVDDDPINLKILEAMLAQEQYHVVVVTNGADALKQLELREWDLVIADVMMPQMSGYELTRKIRFNYSISELPVLLLTARSRPEDVFAGFSSGANDYVTKPVGAMELKARVRALVELKHSIHERLQMEAAWLQAQIQPHFLFNTLNSIASLSESDPGRMVILLEEFGNYLRKSFDLKNLERVVPLDHELELLHSYLYIEKERFGERLKIDWQVPALVEADIPPLSLQTLVENAVRHGILARASGGTVTIRIAEFQAEWEFAVTDDGVGIEEDKLQQLLTGTPTAPKGVGLINTDRRLKQIYGQGLQISSVPHRGTTVKFRVPKQQRTTSKAETGMYR
ncbi:response regulator [Paenibacillus sp. alder61]|uniref:hybrid sensor histidine kinase/response regulator n=1 Tax=Paenibacillus sp. alder61 TaxID=2862948 RepID=UPI001CD31A08|nr:ATP-binding protein [Paenibacillus sp. alder61]MCA1294304.1 response regulator [Paenibacillus sp. alder61]